MITISDTLKNSNLKFCRVLKNSKRPFEIDWPNKPYTHQEIEKFLLLEENYGVLCGYENLIVIDADTQELQMSVEELLPPTYSVTTGSGGTHNYFFCEECKEKIILISSDMNGSRHWGEIQASGSMVVGPNSIHPNNNLYIEKTIIPISKITYSQLMRVAQHFIDEKVNELEEKEDKSVDDFDSLKVSDIWGIDKLKKNRNEFYGAHPIHGSNGGMNFWLNINKNTWHCFRCNSGGGPLLAIAVKEGIIDCSAAKRGVLRGDLAREAIKLAKEKYNYNPISIKTNEINKLISQSLDKRETARNILKIQSFYFDEGNNWWIWDYNLLCWKLIDEVNILNIISQISNVNTVRATDRTEILEALRQEARLNKPQKIKNTWVQFKDEILDIMTGERIISTPKYFITNPIPYKLHPQNYELTPVMDKIFEEWVGKDRVKTLYQIISYCLLPDYPIHRLFCLFGAGSNGKSCFLKLIEKLIGEKNCCSTELDLLLKSRFEITRLYKKLVCIMGETNFNELTQTSTIKKLTGQDLIGFEYKNKTPFEDHNYAKILIATNNLPVTNDKSIGFYRRWCILDFPNEFTEKKDILTEIPEEEFESLALKCCIILKDLLVEKEFYGEGNITTRAKAYEDRSNPFEKFWKEEIAEDFNSFIFKWDFRQKFENWCKSNKFRLMDDKTISHLMKNKGINSSYKSSLIQNKDGTFPRYFAWEGIKWKEF